MRVLRFAQDDKGWLGLEIGYGQKEALESLLLAAGFHNVEFIDDLQGIARVACAVKPVLAH